MTSMTASALRPLRSKCSRWRSPLPLPCGPGTTETQFGSHSAMRVGSVSSWKTASMDTPTWPAEVREEGRRGVIWRQGAVEGGNGREQPRVGSVRDDYRAVTPVTACYPPARRGVGGRVD